MSTSEKACIILVHGLWADGSCWNKIIAPLLKKGHDVIAVQNPLTSLEDDVAAVQRALNRARTPVILVGHSWGGFVITEAGRDPRVKALIYVAALAPDSGETVASLGIGFEPAPLFSHIETNDEYIWLKREALQYFAGDLSEADQDLIHATQGPANTTLLEATLKGEAAWKNKKSFYILATGDGAINPDQQRAMSRKIQADVHEVDSSHAVMMSHPDVVLDVIAKAV